MKSGKLGTNARLSHVVSAGSTVGSKWRYNIDPFYVKLTDEAIEKQCRRNEIKARAEQKNFKLYGRR